MFTPEQKIEHLKKLGFDGDLSEIYKLYSNKPFNVDDKNYRKLVAVSKDLCDEYTNLMALTNHQDINIAQAAQQRRSEIIDILFPGHGSIYGFGEWSQVVIGLVDTDGFNLINVRCKFSPTSLVHLEEYVFVAPNVIFGNTDINNLHGILKPSKILIKNNTWICAAVSISENAVIGNRSVVAMGANIVESSNFNDSKLVLGNPAIEKKTITSDYVGKITPTKILRTDEDIKKILQTVRELGITGDLEQYINMLECKNHNCLEPVMNKLYTLTHQLCAEYNHTNTSITRKKVIEDILFPLHGENLSIGTDLFVDILGATKFGNNIIVGDRVNFAGNIDIGNNVSIGNDCILQTIGHEMYYKKRQLEFHTDGYPIEINTCGFITVKDDLTLANGTKILPCVTLDRNTTENELVIK